MSENEIDGNMWKDNLEEWVYEETKIVTYKWLSKQICVHVNVAKQMLYDFMQKHISNTQKPELEVIYLLAGRLNKRPKNVKVCLVKSCDLATKEAEFESLTSKHVYAISKAGTSLMKEENLCQVDLSLWNEDRNRSDAVLSKYSAIRNKTAVPNRLPNVDQGHEEPIVPAKPKSELSNEQSSKSTDKAKNSGGIQGMFEKQKSTAAKKELSSGNNAEVKPNQSNPTSKSVTKSASLKGSGIVGMLAKAAAKQSTSKATSQKQKESLNSNEVDLKYESENSPGKENRINIARENQNKQHEKRYDSRSTEKEEKEYGSHNKIPIDAKSNKNGHKNDAGKRKRGNSHRQNTESDIKRRKRIQVMSDSDSSEENDDDQNMNISSSPPPPQAKLIESDEEEVITATANPTNKKISKPGRHRIRKQVSKTFVDEEGFMVTKKVMESCSESDEEQETIEKELKQSSETQDKKEGAGNSKAASISKCKNTFTANNKQSSIMSFFQKK